MAYTMLLLLGAYADVGLAQTGVPMLSALPAMLVGGVLYFHRFFSPQALYAFALAGGVYMWSLFAPDTQDFLSARTIAFGQFVYSLVVGLLMFWTVSRYSRAQILRFLHYFLIGYLVLIAIEVFTPFSRLVDAYMSAAFGQADRFIEIIENRDLGVGLGLRRPKVFLSETSHVAMTFAFTLGMKSFLEKTGRKVLFNLLIGLAGTVLIRSPIAASGLIFVALAYGLNLTRHYNPAVRVMALAGAALALGGVLIALQNLIFVDRVASIQSGEDYSTTFRTYGSIYAAFATGKAYPVFGAGIGSIEVAKGVIIRTYSMLQIPTDVVLSEWRRQIQNLPAALLVYLGWVGTFVFSVATVLYWRYLAGRLRTVFWALFTLEAFTLSAFYSPEFYAYLFIFLATSAVQNREETARALSGPARPAGSRRCGGEHCVVLATVEGVGNDRSSLGK